MEFTASSPDEKVTCWCCQRNFTTIHEGTGGGLPTSRSHLCGRGSGPRHNHNPQSTNPQSTNPHSINQVQSTVRIVDSRGSGPPCLKTFQRLHILDFDSTRKRMSVIVRNPSGSLVLVSKGAESSILPLCTAGPVLEVNRSIDEYAVQGLRSELKQVLSFEGGKL